MLERETARSGNVLQSEQKRHIGISNGDALKVVVIRSQEVEEILAAAAVKHDFSVSRRFHHDWFLGGAALSEIVRAIERCTQRRKSAVEATIDEAADVFVNSGMQKNDVARLNSGGHHVIVI